MVRLAVLIALCLMLLAPMSTTDGIAPAKPRPVNTWEPVLVVLPSSSPTAGIPSVVRRQPRPKVTGFPVTTGPPVSGVPTWYCEAGVSRCTNGYPDRPGTVDLYAAAGPSLRIGKWRGRVVRVCAKTICISVRLIDWCACAAPHFLDLYHDAWIALGRPHLATVTW